VIYVSPALDIRIKVGEATKASNVQLTLNTAHDISVSLKRIQSEFLYKNTVKSSTYSLPPINLGEESEGGVQGHQGNRRRVLRPLLINKLHYDLSYDESNEAYNSLVTTYLDGQSPKFTYFDEAPNPYYSPVVDVEAVVGPP
jgi:hypothetical protein